jgi:hypothetical protein
MDWLSAEFLQRPFHPAFREEQQSLVLLDQSLALGNPDDLRGKLR